MFSLVFMYVLLFLCILSSSVEFISEIFSFLFATCLSVFPPPFQFPLDEVGLRPLVLWHTKKSFTSHMENVLLSMEVMLVTLDTCICHYATRVVVQC